MAYNCKQGIQQTLIAETKNGEVNENVIRQA